MSPFNVSPRRYFTDMFLFIQRCCSFAQKRINKMECSVKSRDDPVIMKLDSKEFKSIFNDEVCTLKALFEKYGYEIRLAGGPVRFVEI